MTIGTTLLFCAGGALALRYLRFWIEMVRLPTLLAKEAKRNRDAAAGRAGRRPLVYFVFPVLEEQSTLPRAIATLERGTPPTLRGNVRIVVATTETERARRLRLISDLKKLLAESSVQLSTLTAILRVVDPPLRAAFLTLMDSGLDRAERQRQAFALLESWPYSWDCADHIRCSLPIMWLHSDDPAGNMATQLNVAVAALLSKSSDPAATYLVCFNADTDAADESVSRLFDLLERKDPLAVQLNCVAMRNFATVAEWSSLYAAGGAVQAARWCLGYEYRMFRPRGDRHLPSLVDTYRYCRGQGMTFRLDLLGRLGGFDESTPLEDLFQGFVLSSLSVECPPVPSIDWTDTPETVRSLIAQKRFWYSGMVETFRYPRLLRQRGVAPTVSRAKQTIMMGAGLYRDVFTWLLGPSCVLAFVVFSALAEMYALASLPLLNALLSTLLVMRATPARIRGTRSRRHFLSQAAVATVGYLLFSLTRNVGPLLAIFDRVRRSPQSILIDDARRSPSLP